MRTTGALLGCCTTEVEEEVVLLLVFFWKNSAAETEEDVDDRAEEEEPGIRLWTTAGEDVGAAINAVVGAMGVTKVVGSARLTLAPFRDVTGTGEGMEGAADVFIAESIQVLIHP